MWGAREDGSRDGPVYDYEVEAREEGIDAVYQYT